ncbi:MAG TPA: hypothetical protein VFN53_09610 [Acidobacteriaceae bacterium]|nr:hypothetical protein [Acidobacteriaceae bacterium]
MNSEIPKNQPPESAAKLPGVAAIALWLLLEALIGVAGVFTSHFATHAARTTVLAVATFLAVASLGLLRMKRWGWALALAAAFLSSSYGIYMIMRFHQNNFWVMTLVNFVFFFYLVRPEILRRLR